MQQPSSSKSSWKVKREAEPTMFSIDNMSYIKEEPSEDKMPQSNPLWQNITEARTSKLQLRATPIEVSTGKYLVFTNIWYICLTDKLKIKRHTFL